MDSSRDRGARISGRRLEAGQRLGHCEIVGPIGAGGMGEVYRARDSRLRRDVALKVLPPALVADPARRARFVQEAGAASALVRHVRARRAVLLVGAVVSLLGAVPQGAQPSAQNGDVWRPLRFMLGTWDTTSSGQPGNGTGTREYRLVLGDGFIECRTRVTYPPQDNNPKGEIHEDIGLISYDRTRKAFVLRQFHKEGFVNTYVAASDKPHVFTTEAIENIPSGFRARETYREVSPTEFVEVFELAEPGKDFAVYSETRLTKRR